MKKKQIVRWKPYLIQYPDGSIHRGQTWGFDQDVTLLQRILMMPAGIPISFHRAWNLHSFDMWETLDEDATTFFERCGEDWIRWVSHQGFRISLSQDAFEIID